MASHLTQNTDCVTVTQKVGNWHVRLIEAGKSRIITFRVKEHARAYAEGQRQRLKSRGLLRRLEGEVGIISISDM